MLQLTAATAYAQTDPWSTAATRLATDFTGPIAKGLCFSSDSRRWVSNLLFQKAGSKRAMGGLIFGLGLALGASQFVT